MVQDGRRPGRFFGSPLALPVFSVSSVLKGFEVSLFQENPQNLSTQRTQRKEEAEFLDGF
jgi:hypothetical protein